MYCTPIFVLVLVANLALSGAISQGNPIPNNDNPPPYGGSVLTNFANGDGRVNNVVLRGGVGYAKSADLGNRFGEEIHIRGGPSGYGGSIISNVANGNGNRNTIVSTGGGQGTGYTQISTVGGKTFITQDGTEPLIYNVGMGKDNHNIITHNGKPVVPQNTDSRGSTYNIQRPNGESTIYVSNTGARQTSEVTSIVKSLYGITSQLQQIIAILTQEATKLNLKLQ